VCCKIILLIIGVSIATLKPWSIPCPNVRRIGKGPVAKKIRKVDSLVASEPWPSALRWNIRGWNGRIDHHEGRVAGQLLTEHKSRHMVYSRAPLDDTIVDSRQLDRPGKTKRLAK
jgi:hypothetical protein